MKKIILGLILLCGFIFYSHAMQDMQKAIQHKDWCKVSAIIGNCSSEAELQGYANALLNTSCDLNASNQDHKLLLYELLAIAVAYTAKRQNVSYVILQLLRAQKIDPKVRVEGDIFYNILNKEPELKNYAIILNDLIAKATKANDVAVSEAAAKAAASAPPENKAAPVEVFTQFKVLMLFVAVVAIYSWYVAHDKPANDAEDQEEDLPGARIRNSIKIVHKKGS